MIASLLQDFGSCLRLNRYVSSILEILTSDANSIVTVVNLAFAEFGDLVIGKYPRLARIKALLRESIDEAARQVAQEKRTCLHLSGGSMAVFLCLLVCARSPAADRSSAVFCLWRCG